MMINNLSDKFKILDTIQNPEDIKSIKYSDLKYLAAEIRELIINVVSKNGGHLAPSLGVVELTIALLRSLNLSQDRVVWDVGHQSYAYKILTDRRDRFHTVRQYQGVSGFCSPMESIYDTAISGHTSTSISLALGVKIGDRLQKRKSKVVAVIGDGALGGGLAFEALNNLGSLKEELIIILNDNEMSIGKNVGAFATYLSKTLTGEFVTKIKRDLENIIEDAPLGDKVINFVKRVETSIISFFTPGSIFEDLGIKYIGPIDGHNVRDIEKAIANATYQRAPVIIHVTTVKGKDYLFAEQKPDIFHGVPPFDISTGELLNSVTEDSWSDIFGKTITKMASTDNRIVAITAAMKDGTGLQDFASKYPSRFYDVGIAEQHAVTFAAGLATSGMRPYFVVYSTFLQRAYDQVIHDVAISKLPVTFCIDRAGIVGSDGPTHHGVFDLSFLRAVPNITIMMPKDKDELEMMLRLSLEINSPVVIRYPRGVAASYSCELPINKVELYKPEIVFKGGKIAIISVGHIFDEALKLYNILVQQNKSLSLINLRFLKPLNSQFLLEELSDKTLIITIEENSLAGGVGEMIQSLLIDNDIYITVKRYGIRDEFVSQGDQLNLRKDNILSAETIYETLKSSI